MESTFNIWLLLAGIWVLLYGMNVFENSIKYLWWNKLKWIIQKYTKTWWASIFTGFWTTSVLQSSSLLSLLVLAFAWAWVLTLKNSIWLIFWANIWSPMLPLLAAVVGFGEFKISAFALPMIAIWGLSFIFNLSERQKQRARLLLWFGLLFLGLDFMKESVDAITATFDLTAYKDMSLWGFGALGIVVTLVIQSSGALWVMALAALDGWIITFPASIAIAMWSNIWTTFTAVIGSLWWSRVKRQIAVSHVLFNVFSGVIGVIFFWQYIHFTNEILWFSSNPVMGNAVLNIVFNASTAILFGFFLVPFTKLVLSIMPNIKSKGQEIPSLKTTTLPALGSDTTINQAAVYALVDDSKLLCQQTLHYLTYALNIDSDYLEKNNFDQTSLMKHEHKREKSEHQQQYETARETANTLYEFVLQLRPYSLPTSDAKALKHTEESIEACLRSLKSIKNIYHDLQDLAKSSSQSSKKLYIQSRFKVASIAKHLFDIIDNSYTEEDFEEVRQALNELDSFHTGFEHYLSEMVNDGEETDIPLSVLMNIDHYLFQGSEKLVDAVRKVYL